LVGARLPAPAGTTGQGWGRRSRAIHPPPSRAVSARRSRWPPVARGARSHTAGSPKRWRGAPGP